MSIPLVQNNEKDSINTSIIAIKRNIERINMLLGLSNSEEIDTSEFVKKSDIVDEVTVGNMQSVTSNAVAEVTTKVYSYNQNSIEYYKVGKVVIVQMLKAISGSSPKTIYTLPEEFRPTNRVRGLAINNRTDIPCGQSVLEPDGTITVWLGGGGSFNGDEYIILFNFIQS